jgi:hypothetical protein
MKLRLKIILLGAVAVAGIISQDMFITSTAVARQRSLEIVENEKSLDPRACSIKITSAPPGAEIYISGIHLMNRTPYKMIDLVEGIYMIELIKDGYREYKARVKVQPGEETEINATLEVITKTAE